ncbi:hypothetical protein IGI04_029560, partial [Brassica rapa subsp. trilocularis]
YGLFFLGRSANQKKAHLAYLFFLIRLSKCSSSLIFASEFVHVVPVSILHLPTVTSNKLFKEQEYHDAVRHHTEAIQRNPKEPTTRHRGMQDQGIKNILTDLRIHQQHNMHTR